MVFRNSSAAAKKPMTRATAKFLQQYRTAQCQLKTRRWRLKLTHLISNSWKNLHSWKETSRESILSCNSTHTAKTKWVKTWLTKESFCTQICYPITYKLSVYQLQRQWLFKKLRTNSKSAKEVRVMTMLLKGLQQREASTQQPLWSETTVRTNRSPMSFCSSTTPATTPFWTPCTSTSLPQRSPSCKYKQARK